MKENTLDVLFYLFDNYPDIGDNLSENRESMHDYLQDAGFLNSEITRAFDWLESLGDNAERVEATAHRYATRVFSIYEQRWLDAECQGYLMYLENSGVISPEAREQIIDRIMELEDTDFNIDRLKWVVMMVLINRPEEGNSFFWAEGLNMQGGAPILH
jgi:Smg protein